jgi:hypothetical protein
VDRGAFSYSPVPSMTKLQWVYVIIGLLVALSMILAVLPVGR